MRVVISLDSSALRQCSEPMTSEAQQDVMKHVAQALAPLARKHRLIVSHGLGRQVGLLTLDAPAHRQVESYPLDMIGAQAEGMLGTRIKQALHSLPTFGAPTRAATILTMVEVDPNDVSPSPAPKRIFAIQAIRRMLRNHAVVFCSGVGLSMTVADTADHAGNNENSRIVRDAQRVETMIDADRISALMAKELDADFLVLVTNVEGVYLSWGRPDAKLLKVATPTELKRLRFDDNSIGPKVEVACEFVTATGAFAAIGKLEDIEGLLTGRAGTTIEPDSKPQWIERLEHSVRTNV